MKKVEIMINGYFIGVSEMTVTDIRKAEKEGFTIKEMEMV